MAKGACSISTPYSEDSSSDTDAVGQSSHDKPINLKHYRMLSNNDQRGPSVKMVKNKTFTIDNILGLEDKSTKNHNPVGSNKRPSATTPFSIMHGNSGLDYLHDHHQQHHPINISPTDFRSICKCFIIIKSNM